VRSYYKGQLGEQQALHYLESQGYILITTNFRSRIGEIDIIVKTADHMIVFVEVKYYKENSLIHPTESITPRKKKRILHTAQWYIHKYGIENTMFRFDLLVVKDRSDFEHYKNIISL